MELEVRLKKKLRSFTLRVDFTVKDEIFALLGASGCGKSMTLKCIAGIEQPDSGRIVLNGRVLYDSNKGINLPPQQRHIGYLFQNYALFPNMTIGDNIRFIASGTKEEKERKTRENLARFSLTGLMDAYPAELSGGQQQRAALARILASDAELMLLDEPFSALDSYLKWQLELELFKVLKSYQGAALLVSHDRGEVYRLADRIAVIQHGQLESVQEKHTLFQNPETLAATLLTGCKNISAVRKLSDKRIFAADWQLELNSAVPVPETVRYAGLRAHFLEYREQEGENTFLMEAVRVIEDVFSYLVMIRKAGTDAQLIRWELGKDEWQAIRSERFYIYFPPEQLMLMEK